MAPEKTQSLFSFENIKSVIVGVFLIGAAWSRMEYKINEMSVQMLNKIDMHIQADGWEKKEIKKDVSELNVSVNTMKEYLNSEFIRPEAPRLENKRRRQ